jgi:2-hydroxy-3-oxopropionate reductase
VSMQEHGTPVGFVGLGVMGAPMAANLLRRGHEVIGYNRSAPATEALVARGGKAAANVAELARSCPIVITMLPDDAAVDSVYFEDGLLANASPETLLVDMSTVSPGLSRRIAKAAARAGAMALDAPVSGGEQGAVEATLSIMVGGEEDAFVRAEPVLNALGKTITHAGPAGSGQTVKAANQLLVGGIIELVAEAIVFLNGHNVDLPAALKVLAGGLAGNRILDRKATDMLAHNFTPGFRIDLHHKDMGILLDAARETGTPLPLGAVVAQLFTVARARGDGSLDHTALLRTIEALAGRI